MSTDAEHRHVLEVMGHPMPAPPPCASPRAGRECRPPTGSPVQPAAPPTKLVRWTRLLCPLIPSPLVPTRLPRLSTTHAEACDRPTIGWLTVGSPLPGSCLRRVCVHPPSLPWCRQRRCASTPSRSSCSSSPTRIMVRPLALARRATPSLGAVQGSCTIGMGSIGSHGEA